MVYKDNVNQDGRIGKVGVFFLSEKCFFVNDTRNSLIAFVDFREYSLIWIT